MGLSRSSLPVLVSPTSVTCAAFLPTPKKLLLCHLPAPDHLTNPTPAGTPAPALLCTGATGDGPSMANLLTALGMCQLLTAVGPSSHEHPHHSNDYPSVQTIYTSHSVFLGSQCCLHLCERIETLREAPPHRPTAQALASSLCSCTALHLHLAAGRSPAPLHSVSHPPC